VNAKSIIFAVVGALWSMRLSALPLSGMTIVVDPGHGGTLTGAVNSNPYLVEKDLNLAVGLCSVHESLSCLT
jgi:N-acetylmuramoyl-L-alanine amidase